VLHQVETFFVSFQELREIDDDLDDLRDLELHIEKTFDLMSGDIKTYEDLNKALTFENLYIDHNNPLSRTSGFGGMTADDFLRIVNSFGSFLKYIEYYMEPDKNGFKLEKYNYTTNWYDSHEIWTEGKCLMIKNDYFEKFI